MIREQVLADTLRQTDCGPVVARYGCYAWVHAMAAQLRVGDVFSRARFDQTLREAGKRLRYDGLPVVDQTDITLNEPEVWAQMCFDALAPQRFRVWQVGTGEGWFAGERWYKGPAVDDYSYLALRWDRPNGNHWTYLDPYNGVAWDPHGSLRPLGPVGLGVVMYLVREIR